MTDGAVNFGDRGRNAGGGTVNFGERGASFGERGANFGERRTVTSTSSPSDAIANDSLRQGQQQIARGRQASPTPSSRVVGTDGAGRTLFADSGTAEYRAAQRIGNAVRIPGRSVQVTESGGGGSRTPISDIPDQQPSGIEIVVAAGSATQNDPPPPSLPIRFGQPTNNPCQVFEIVRGSRPEGPPESPEDEDAAGDGGNGTSGDSRVSNNASPQDDPCVNSESPCRWYPVGSPQPPGTVSRGTGGVDGDTTFELFCPNDGIPPTGDAGCGWQSPPPPIEPEPLPSCQTFRINFQYTRKTVVNSATCATSDNFVTSSVLVTAPYSGFELRQSVNQIGNCNLDLVFQSSTCDEFGNVTGSTEVIHSIGGNFNCSIGGCGPQVTIEGFAVTSITPV